MSFSNDIVLGFDRTGKAVVLPKELRSRHSLALGATGVGKSSMLAGIVRNDLLAWHKSRCGLALFDPHGTVVDNIVAFAAAVGLDHLPIIPLDCRRLEWITSFNPLRARPGIEPATIISSCIDSLLHAWGQWDNGNQTPRLEKWLRTVLLTVFLSGGTLGDSLAILRSPDLRRSMARTINDDVARSVWQSSLFLKESEFQSVTESLANRVVRFVSATMLWLSLNQTGVSLDFGTIMAKGHIVLISLATSGGAIDETDARTIGALLLQDLWMAAKIRGKGEAGRKKSFRVFIDEFSHFLTPTMAEGLAEARGFGLELFLSCQSTTQMCATAAGRQVLDAVLANAHTKIIFNVQHPDDLDILTPWLYRNEVDTDQVKHQHYATRVLGHRVEYRDSTSQSTTRGTADSSNWSRTNSTAHTAGISYTHTDTTGVAHSTQHGHSIGQNTSLSLGSDESVAESTAESEATGTTESRAAGRVRQQSSGESESRHLDGGYDDLAKIVGPEPITTFDRAYVDEDEEHRALHRTIDETASEGESQSDSQSSSLATTRSTSNARALQTAESHSQALSLGMNESLSEGESDTESFQTSDSVSESESTTVGVADAKGGDHTDSQSASEGVTNAPMLMPILGKEALPPLFRSTDEQLFIYSQQLSSLPDRHAVVRTGTTPPIEIVTPTIAPAAISAKGARAWANLKLKKLPFALSFTDATNRLAERQKLFMQKYLISASTDEPIRTVRRIKE